MLKNLDYSLILRICDYLTTKEIIYLSEIYEILSNIFNDWIYWRSRAFKELGYPKEHFDCVGHNFSAIIHYQNIKELKLRNYSYLYNDLYYEVDIILTYLNPIWVLLYQQLLIG